MNGYGKAAAVLLFVSCLHAAGAERFSETRGDRADSVLVSGERVKWHPVTFSFVGPDSGEAAVPNPFMDYRLSVRFSQDEPIVDVFGYYAADGDAAESGCESGRIWRVRFVPDREGVWEYRVSFRTGPNIATSEDPNAGEPVALDGVHGHIEISPAKSGVSGFLGKGMLRHRGGRYLQFAETGEIFLKGGADSPENLLAFADFDGTKPSHRYEPHAADWRAGDPVWRGEKGRNLIGALNYLAGKGMNSVYFLTMNVGGDGKDVWPWTSDAERFRFDCGKLDQWEIVFAHMDRLGLMLHVVTQEQENDQLLDGGALGPERKLYYRELVARFAHHPALVWNLGEENTNTPEQRRAFADYLRALDPYDHPIVIHTFPSEREKVYADLLGYPNLDGPSLQLARMEETYAETRKWIRRSQDAARPWFVCLDEIGPPHIGAKPDAEDPEHDDVRRFALWGNLMAGGAGCEWLFGYDSANNDITCEDWRSRDRMWDQTRFALEFFRRLPLAEMEPADGLVDDADAWCLAKPGEIYAVYAPKAASLGVTLPKGRYRASWYNPRAGGPTIEDTLLRGGSPHPIGEPPADPERDWALLLTKNR